MSEQNGWHFADGIYGLIHITPKCVAKCSANNKLASSDCNCTDVPLQFTKGWPITNDFYRINEESMTKRGAYCHDYRRNTLCATDRQFNKMLWCLIATERSGWLPWAPDDMLFNICHSGEILFIYLCFPAHVLIITCSNWLETAPNAWVHTHEILPSAYTTDFSFWWPVEIPARCLTAPKYCLTQCWLIIEDFMITRTLQRPVSSHLLERWTVT